MPANAGIQVPLLLPNLHDHAFSPTQTRARLFSSHDFLSFILSTRPPNTNPDTVLSFSLAPHSIRKDSSIGARNDSHDAFVISNGVIDLFQLNLYPKLTAVQVIG